MRIVAACVIVSSAGCATLPPEPTLRPAAAEVRAHGALREMFHEGRTGAMVRLDSLLPDPDLYAVGALADLAGEVTILGGKVFASFPEGMDDSRTETALAAGAGATLLVSATVPAWGAVRIERAIEFAAIDAAIERLATAAGIEPDSRVPFLVEGVFEDLAWHVIDGRRLGGAGQSHEQHLAAAVRHRIDRAEATLVGFFSRKDQGVFTHLGSSTHIHCVVGEPPAAGHVDHVTIPAGSVIRFPSWGRARVARP